MPVFPPKWGPQNGVDSKDYIPYMQPPGGAVTDTPISLLGHSLGAPNQNLTDQLLFTEVALRNGVVRTVSRVKRAAEETSRTYTIGLPSALWTPVIEQILREGCGDTAFFLLYQCPEDSIYGHWDILPEGRMNPAIEAVDVITTGDDTNIITQTADVTVPEKLRGFVLSWLIIYDSTVAYNSIIFIEEECPTCGDFAQSAVAVGGDGVAIPLEDLTDNRFGTVTTLTSGAAIATVAQTVFNRGDLIAIGYLITAPTGEVRVSYDRGTTWVVVPGIAEPILDIKEFGDVIWLVGGDSAGGGKIYFSEDDLRSVTEVTNALIPAAAPLNKIAYDPDVLRYYITGDSATLLSARFTGSTLSMADISGNLPGSPTDLNGLLVRAKNEVVVGGNAAYLAESHDGGVTFTLVALAGTDLVVAIAGNLWRMVVATTGDLFGMTALGKYRLEAVVLDQGQTVSGLYTDVIMNINDDFNRFVAVTDAGEVVMGVPNYPNA